MPLPGVPPDPYDLTLGGNGYLRPPQDVMVQMRDFWFRRESVPWFPERLQTAGISESQFPSKAELPFTVKDRSGGFGYSEWPEGLNSGTGVYAYTDQVDADDQGADCSVPGISFLGPFNNRVGSLPGGDLAGDFELTVGGTRYLFIVKGQTLYRTTDGLAYSPNIPGTGTVMPTLAHPLTGHPRVFQGSAATPLVFFPEGSAYVSETWDGSAVGFTNLSAADNDNLIDAVVVDDKFWGLWYDTTSKKYRVSNMQDGGTSPTWNPSYVVGDASSPALTLMFGAGRLFVGGESRLRQLADDLGDKEQTILVVGRDSNNFRWWNTAQSGNELWFNTYAGTTRIAAQGDQLVLAQIGPETLPGNRSPVRGAIRAKAADDFCQYLFLRTTDGVTYLLKHRHYADNREAPHVILRIGTYDVNYAFVSYIGTNPMLIFGLDATTIGAIKLPRNGLYPPADPNCEFATKGRIYDSRQFGGLYFVLKTLLAYTARTQDCTGTETITPYYNAVNPSAFTQFATGGTISEDPGRRIALETPVTVPWWDVAVDLARGTDKTKTPKLLAATSHFRPSPEARGEFTFYLWIADYTKQKSSAQDFRSASDVQDALLAYDGSSLPVTMVDDSGSEFSVIIGTVDVFSVYLSADEQPEKVAKLTATEWAAILRGSHSALARLTHDQLASYTHDQLAQVMG